MKQFSLMQELSESRQFPMRKTLEQYTAHEIAQMAFLQIIGLRICLIDDETKEWATHYCRKTTRATDFAKWRGDGTDLYILINALVDHHTKFKDGEKEGARFEIYPRDIYHWVHDGGRHTPRESETHRLLTRLDTLFRIHNSSLHSLRRLVQDWPKLDEDEARIAMTSLLSQFRKHMPKAEMLSPLSHMSKKRNLEIQDPNEMDAYHESASPAKNSLLLKLENASIGSTSSASIAMVSTSVGNNIGHGFDDDHSKSIYPAPKKPKEKKSLSLSR